MCSDVTVLLIVVLFVPGEPVIDDIVVGRVPGGAGRVVDTDDQTVMTLDSGSVLIVIVNKEIAGSID